MSRKHALATLPATLEYPNACSRSCCPDRLHPSTAALPALPDRIGTHHSKSWRRRLIPYTNAWVRGPPSSFSCSLQSTLRSRASDAACSFCVQSPPHRPSSADAPSSRRLPSTDASLSNIAGRPGCSQLTHRTARSQVGSCPLCFKPQFGSVCRG